MKPLHQPRLLSIAYSRHKQVEICPEALGYSEAEAPNPGIASPDPAAELTGSGAIATRGLSRNHKCECGNAFLEKERIAEAIRSRKPCTGPSGVSLTYLADHTSRCSLSSKYMIATLNVLTLKAKHRRTFSDTYIRTVSDCSLKHRSTL